MFAELLLQAITALGIDPLLVIPVLDFLVKSILLVILVLYFDKNNSPFFSSAQKRMLWLTVLVLLGLLPMASMISDRILDTMRVTPDLTLLTVLVSSEGSISQSVNALWHGGWMSLLIAIYCAGVLLHLCRLALSILQTYKIRQNANYDVPENVLLTLREFCIKAGINRDVRLGSSALASSPMTFGTLQPTIIVPSASYYADHELLENVLIHELSHIKRLDHLIFILGYFLAALNWFNPFVWFALRNLDMESEFACDDEVLCQRGKGHQFANQLVGLARSGLDKFDAALASRSILSRGQLTLRVEHILDGSCRSYTGRMYSHQLPINVLICTFLLMSTGKIFAVDNADGYTSEDLRLVYSELPVYPEAAVEKGATGFTQFSFRVNEYGRIDRESIRLLRSDSSALFEDSSVQALNSFVFAPRRVNGRLVATPDVLYTFNFDIRI